MAPNSTYLKPNKSNLGGLIIIILLTNVMYVAPKLGLKLKTVAFNPRPPNTYLILNIGSLKT
jgi:hypothetical protein